MAKMDADGKVVPQAGLKAILLHLLLVSNAGDEAKVAEVFREAMRGDANDVESFRLALINWLGDKVVDGWPPLPEELQNDPPAEAQARLDVGANAAAAEEWLPATEAVDWAEEAGHPITLKWVTKDASKCGVRTRPSQLPGRHKVEVEWNSLAGCLLRRALSEKEPDETTMSASLREEQERKRRERPLD
jgi:hypothetical protein